MNETIERLELKLAFLERANQELSDVVYRQQRELEDLRSQLAVVVSHMDALKADAPEYTPEQERPPHY